MADTLPTLAAAMRIPKHLLEDFEIDEMRRSLTFAPKSGNKYGFGERGGSVMLYDQTPDWIEVPRAYGLHVMRNFSKLRGINFVDRTSGGTKVEFTFNEEKQRQKPTHKRIQDRLVSESVQKMRGGVTGGVLCAPCGTGKTVAGCKVAAEMGLTTLILAHKEFLVSQWVERIHDWLGIPEEEVGIVQQNRCEYHGRKIVVAMLQSIVERDYTPALYDWPGLVIADEVHRHGASLWHKAALRFTSKYRLGLTATPDRSDGMWRVVTSNFGEILALDHGEAMSPTIYVVKFNPFIPLQAYCWINGYMMGEPRIKKVYLGKLTTLLAEHPERNQMITDIILKAAREERKVFLLTDRLSQIRILKENICEQGNGEVTVGRYVGGMSKSARSLSEQCQVMLGTYQMAQEGLDIPALDVGILGTPHANAEQAIGRICRHMDGKKQPIIVDIVDNEKHVCLPFFYKRKALFDRREWPVQYIG